MLVAGAALSLLTGATGLALPLVVRELIGGLRSDRGVAGLLGLFARRQLVSRLLWLRVPAVDAAGPGDLMSRVTSDTTLLRR